MTEERTTDQRALRVAGWRRVLHAFGVYFLLAGLCAAGWLVSPKFASPANLLNILRNVTLLGIVCTGVAFITYSRHFVDLSIPAIMAFVGLVTIALQPYGIGVSLAAGLAAGLLIGAINGYVVGYWRVNPIIWTLAMAFLLDGLLRWGFAGRQLYPDPATSGGAFFLSLAQREVGGGLPFPTLAMIVLAAVAYGVMKHSRFGAQVQLVGSAYETARLSGVHVRRVVMQVFVLSAFTTAVAGLFLTSMNKQGTFETGLGYDFNAITAVVLGGASLQGGRASILGVMGGVLVIGVLLNLMTLLGLDSFTQLVIKGCVFIGVVAATTWFARRSGRQDE